MSEGGDHQPGKLAAQLDLILSGGVDDAEAYPIGSHPAGATLRSTDGATGAGATGAGATGAGASGAGADGGGTNAAPDFRHLARRGHVLIRDSDVDRVAATLGGEANNGPVNLNGMTRWAFDTGRHATVEEACRAIDDEHGRGLVTPDHLLYLVPASSCCPATEPEPVAPGTAPVPEVSSRLADGAGVLVHLLDSGLAEGAENHDWMRGVTGDPEQPYREGTTEILSYAGHGTFSAGIVRAVAPAADVHVQQTFRVAGTVYESEMVGDVAAALGAGADVLSLSFGTYTRESIPLLGLDVVEKMLRDYKGVVLVAAAGNDNVREPFFPAASPHTVSVGALDKDWQKKAWFSNFGGWVDVFAPGEDLINAFLTGTFTCVEPPNTGQVRTFDGLASWSGTSFSTPIVSGLIAARMSATGENGRQAAGALLALARGAAIAGLGGVIRPGEKYW